MRKITIAAVLALGLAASAEELHVPARFETIQAAIAAAANGDVVVVAPGTYGEALNLRGKKITLRGSGGAAATILDGSTLTTSILTASSGESRDTVVQGFTFRNGYGTEPPACSVEGRKGGAVFVVAGGLSIVDCVFTDNREVDADGFEVLTAGGALFACQADVSIRGSRFERNGAGTGGAIDFLGIGRRELTIANSTFTNNHGDFGGVSATLYNNSSVTVTDSEFTGNSAAHAAGLSIVGAHTTRASVQRTTFHGNRASGAGGGLYMNTKDSSSATISACRFDGNAAAHGAGLRLNAWGTSAITVADCDAANGTASFGAGANIATSQSGSIEMTGCDFRNNKAGFGGGLFASASGVLTDVTGGRIRVTASRFLDNVAYAEPDTGIYYDVCFTDGRLPEGSGLFYGGGADLRTIIGGSITIASSLFAGNSGMRAGGVHGSSCAGGEIELVNNTIVGNDRNGVHLRFGLAREPGYTDLGRIRVANSIVRGNENDEVAVERFDTRAQAEVTFNNIEGSFAGAGNIDLPPSFLDPEGRDYRLAAGSVCIDAGDRQALNDHIDDADLARRPRVIGNVDMGAYEYQPAAPKRRTVRPR
jgi:predicted outer membrane repeat protein